MYVPGKAYSTLLIVQFVLSPQRVLIVTAGGDFCRLMINFAISLIPDRNETI